MSAFEIVGGNALNGTVIPQGAKNEALQIISAVLLTAEPVIIRNIPEIIDVLKLIDLLQDIGVKVEKLAKGEFKFIADDVNLEYLKTEDYKKKAAALRGSIMLVGPMLGRFGQGYIPKPGGDKIGRRRLDTHFTGFQNLGATFNYDAVNYFYSVTAPRLKGAFMLLDEASVTGTPSM